MRKLLKQRGDLRIWKFSRDSVRELDRRAMDEYGIPGLILMENAARSICEIMMHDSTDCRDRLNQCIRDANPVLICVGPGNNGGDGLALARHLSNHSVPVEIFAAFNPDHVARMSEEARTNYEICQRMTISIRHADELAAEQVNGPDSSFSASAMQLMRHRSLIIDALLGTGLNKPPRKPVSNIINCMNNARPTAYVVAIDIPSGLDCDTGAALGSTCIMADLTVTLTGVKKGFLNPESEQYLGALAVGEIGAPQTLIKELGCPLTESEV